MGVLKNVGPKLRPKISDPDLTLEELDGLVDKYLEDVSVCHNPVESSKVSPSVGVVLQV